ncbi:HK97-gp10 family putative phage morphogenesis protein [Paenochrobactrum pullorum]|uniref:HK97-gp10 family putative phage morphogenesis protein n=1 Tax=Paenochrobactrum pullorum TaxID=1324351 RepID=UPI0035BBF376
MVEGLDRLKRKLTKTIPNAVVEATIKAMEAGADEAVGMMQRLAPKDTGDLAKTIGWTWGDPPRGAMVLSRSPKTSDGLVITIYAGDESTLVGERAQFQLARLQEFGTQHMKASPYFFPSWRALRKRVRARVTRQMRKAIREGAK